MREYFSQFGDVTRVKVSRNKKSGASKHYAFVEFKHGEVASIVAESMNNYLLANQVLKVELIAPEKVHEKTFEGAGRAFKVVPWQRRAAATHNKERDDVGKAKRNKGLVKAENKRREKIAAAGIDYDFPGYKAILTTEVPKKAKEAPAKKTKKGAALEREEEPKKTKATAEAKVGSAKAKDEPAKKMKKTVKAQDEEEPEAKQSTAKAVLEKEAKPKAKTPAAKAKAEPVEEPTSEKKPTPVAKKTRGALKRAAETPAKPAKKSKN